MYIDTEIKLDIDSCDLYEYMENDVIDQIESSISQLDLAYKEDYQDEINNATKTIQSLHRELKRLQAEIYRLRRRR